jgi:hypothetical protein
MQFKDESACGTESGVFRVAPMVGEWAVIVIPSMHRNVRVQILIRCSPEVRRMRAEDAEAIEKDDHLKAAFAEQHAHLGRRRSRSFS